MNIRKAKAVDARECESLQKLDKDSFWEIDDFKKASRDSDVIFLIAEDKSKVVGYVLGFVNLVKRKESFYRKPESIEESVERR